jgi:putative ABC transport system permease protein
LTEALVLSAVGGLGGLAIAVIVQTMLARYAASAFPVFSDITVDRTVIVFAIGLSLLAALFFGVVPALAAARSARLNDRSQTASRRTNVLRHLLVAGEVALAIVLLVGAALLVRSLIRLQQVEPGFMADNAVAFTLTLPTGRYREAPARYAAFTEIERRLREEPGVEAVGAVSRLALRGPAWTSDGTVEGRDPNDFERDLRHKSASPGYFSAAGVRVLAGRAFTDDDRRDATKVTIVNHALALRYFRGENAVGRRLKFARPTDNADWITIVGVIADEKQDSLDKAVEPEAFVPITQQLQNPLSFVVRSQLPPEAIVAAIRRQVGSVDKDLAITQVTTLSDLLRASTAEPRLRTTLLSSFAGIALLLAALGIYGVLAYAVSQRTRELGLRLALGARPAQLFVMVVGEGLMPAAAGAVVGFGAAIGATRVAQSLLFGVEPLDPPAFIAAAGVLGLLSLIACAIPALRAIRVNPMATLRNE